MANLTARADAPPQAVWGALSDPPELEAWLVERADVSLPEGRYVLESPDVPAGEQRLLDAQAGRWLRLAWGEAEVEITVEADEDVGTVLTVSLSGDEAGAVQAFWERALPALVAHVDAREPGA